MRTRSRRLPVAFAAASLAAWALQHAASPRWTADARGNRRLAGDWETADVFLLAREPVWDEAVAELLAALRPHPTYLIAAPGDSAPIPGSYRPALLELPHESAWVRDYGPLAVEDAGRIRWLDARYAPTRPHDDALTATLGRRLGVPVEPLPGRLDGGAVASDGRGLCAMTGRSLRRLRPPGPGWIRERLGCEALAVLPALENEPTGHADLLVHFLAPDVVAVASLDWSVDREPRAAADARRLDVVARRLRRAARRAGRSLEVVRVPAWLDRAERFLTYVNLVPLEHRLLVPDFGGAAPAALQEAAWAALRRASGKEITPVPAAAIALAAGGLHCVVLGLHLPRATGPAAPVAGS